MTPMQTSAPGPAPDPAPAAPGRPARPLPWLAAVALAVVALLSSAGVGYAAGARHSGPVTLAGRAIVGGHVATIEVDGWAYGIRGSIPWIDGSGAQHEDGWPDCLRMGTSPVVRFGAVPVTYPTGIGQRQVLWVDCRAG